MDLKIMLLGPGEPEEKPVKYWIAWNIGRDTENALYELCKVLREKNPRAVRFDDAELTVHTDDFDDVATKIEAIIGDDAEALSGIEEPLRSAQVIKQMNFRTYRALVKTIAGKAESEIRAGRTVYCDHELNPLKLPYERGKSEFRIAESYIRPELRCYDEAAPDPLTLRDIASLRREARENVERFADLSDAVAKIRHMYDSDVAELGRTCNVRIDVELDEIAKQMRERGMMKGE